MDSTEVPSTPLEPPVTVPAIPLKPAKPITPAGVVPWNKDKFLAFYPQFEDKLSDPQLENCWRLACLFLRNDSKSLVPYDPENDVLTRQTLLYLLMCHMCTLALRPYDQSGSVQSSSEGSVSVGFTIPSPPFNQYFAQTPCGQTFWQLFRQFALGGYYFNNQDIHPWG